MLWSILYTDDAGTVSRSKDSLAKIMSVVVETCDTFGLTVSENKTETMAAVHGHYGKRTTTNSGLTITACSYVLYPRKNGPCSSM